MSQFLGAPAKFAPNFNSIKSKFDFRDRTFNLLLNEQFTDEDVEDIIKSIIRFIKRAFCW